MAELKSRLKTVVRTPASVTLVALTSLYLVLSANLSFWREIIKIQNGVSFYTFVLFVLLVATLFTTLSLVNFNRLLKPVVIFLLISSSIAGYFMDAYGTLIDEVLFYSMGQTNSHEASGIIGWYTIIHILVFGILPSLWVLWIKPVYKPFRSQLIHNSVLALAGMMVITLSYVPARDRHEALYNSNPRLSYLLSPANYLTAAGSQLRDRIGMPEHIVAVGTDARIADDMTDKFAGAKPGARHHNKKKNLLILVIGETARADHFSLNGYQKQTNPRLSRQNVISFDNTWSCGTATIVSLPCMLSVFTRDEFSIVKGRTHENLLDVLSHAGVRTIWRNNSTGCMGVCQRVEYIDMSQLKIDDICQDGKCMDGILLHKLQQQIDKLKNHSVIVLHQSGSHGPEYFKQYPQQLETFKPVCKTSRFQNCSVERLVNAYDNTILYTDQLLDQTIRILKNNQQRFNAAMIYISDHGESLGENGNWLHGMPYKVAPAHQKHIPLIMWLSDGFSKNAGINTNCLKQNRNQRYEHDHLFHTILGMMNIKTQVYQPAMDITRSCKPDSMLARLAHIAKLAHIDSLIQYIKVTRLL